MWLPSLYIILPDMFIAVIGHSFPFKLQLTKNRMDYHDQICTFDSSKNYIVKQVKLIFFTRCEPLSLVQICCDVIVWLISLHIRHPDMFITVIGHSA